MTLDMRLYGLAGAARVLAGALARGKREDPR